MFHLRDDRDDDSDTELEDLSEVNPMTNTGRPTREGTDLTAEQNSVAEETYLIMKAALYIVRRQAPRGYRKGFKRWVKRGEQFKSKKGQGKGRKHFKHSHFNKSSKKPNE